MANSAKTRRHYRAAKKQIEQECLSGIIIPDEKVPKVIVIAIMLLIIAAVKGLVIGLFISRGH